MSEPARFVRHFDLPASANGCRGTLRRQCVDSVHTDRDRRGGLFSPDRDRMAKCPVVGRGDVGRARVRIARNLCKLRFGDHSVVRKTGSRWGYGYDRQCVGYRDKNPNSRDHRFGLGQQRIDRSQSRFRYRQSCQLDFVQPELTIGVERRNCLRIGYSIGDAFVTRGRSGQSVDINRPRTCGPVVPDRKQQFRIRVASFRFGYLELKNPSTRIECRDR